jgi:nucleoside phosphorylase
MITGGEPFLIGYKDRPFHVSRVGYIRKLKWIFQKSVVLWDEEAKRGWLLNGASALLHIVRASIVHDCTGPFSSECFFRWEDLEEGPAHPTRIPGSAIGVLLNRSNRALTIYQGRDEHVTFEDRVERFLNILEQIFEYQVHAVGPDASGYNSNSIPRSHFEGWDFHDLATESDLLYPRLANIAAKGKAWIDFTRSLHTINILGRGFGELMEPSNIPCSYWASLPRGQYYLAAGIADLEVILESSGDMTTNPIRLCENLVWHKPEMAFESCGCTDANADHADIVQVILPVAMSDRPEKLNDIITVSHQGAVVFGNNRNFQWRWGDAGDPERDDIKADEEPQLSSDCAVEHGKSDTVSVGSGSDFTRLLSTNSHSMQSTIDTSSTDIESPQTIPLVRSYTKWNLESLRAEDYAVGIVCALPLELLAVRALFDQTHPDLPLSPVDSNHYALGRIGRHKVVAACLPDGEYGTNSAADVASNLRRSFLSVKFCLLVGIGGGVPSSRNDIRLGDVVVSKPIGGDPGVIQYDMGKALENGFFERVGFLQAPPRQVMTALSSLKSDPHLPQAPLREYIDEITTCRKEYRYPGQGKDRLFSSQYVHNPRYASCDLCSLAHVTSRPSRSDHQPQIHYGLVASGNRVMKDAKLRDIWSTEKNVLCFEMEAAGIMNTLPCLVIRGICDYSDSHKNKRFQQYAAATAASYAKLLLSYMRSSHEIEEMVSSKQDKSLLGALRKALYFSA